MLLVSDWYDADTAAELAELGCRPYWDIMGGIPGLTGEDHLPNLEATRRHLLERANSQGVPEYICLSFEDGEAIRHLNGWKGYENGSRFAEALQTVVDTIHTDLRPDAHVFVYGVPWIPLWHEVPRVDRLIPYDALDADQQYEAMTDTRNAPWSQMERCHPAPSLYSWPTQAYNLAWRDANRLIAGDTAIPVLHHRFVRRGSESHRVGEPVPMDRFIIEQAMQVRSGDAMLWTRSDVLDDEGLRERGRTVVNYASIVRQMQKVVQG